MANIIQLGPNKCGHLECPELQILVEHTPYCDFHFRGGVFGSGETYEQYQIIEKDFIDFLNIVPYNSNHSQVYSPVLRDIILRACTQIELFFKEWLVYTCAEDSNHPASIKYNKPLKDGSKAKEKYWEFVDYYFFQKELDKKSLYLKEKNTTIAPFNAWTEKQPPEWWMAYNRIKHRREWKSEAILGNALNAVGALFLLHCNNPYSRKFLKQHTSPFISEHFGRIRLQFEAISTPIDSKRYLFKEVTDNFHKSVELLTKEGLEQDEYFKKRSKIQ